MAAVAQLKALLGLDVEQYRAGMKDAWGHTARFQQQLTQTNDKLRATSMTSKGLANIFRGNLVFGIQQLVSGLKQIPPLAAQAVASLGSIAAAFAGGWMIGGKLDKMTGISGWAAKKFGGTLPKETAESSLAKSLRAERLGRERVPGIDEDTAELKRRSLSGMARIEAEYDNDLLEAKKKRMAATTDAERAAWDRRIEAVRGFYSQEIREFEAAEKKKADAAAAAARDAKARIEQTYGARIAAVRGETSSISARGASVDSYARMGGFVGKSRGGLDIAERTLKLAQEDAARQRRIEALQTEMKTALEELNAKAPGSGTP